MLPPELLAIRMLTNSKVKQEDFGLANTAPGICKPAPRATASQIAQSILATLHRMTVHISDKKSNLVHMPIAARVGVSHGVGVTR